MRQTGRCHNDRLREHRAALSATLSGHLAIHCATCGCAPEIHHKEVVESYRGKVATQIIEAYQIKKEKSQCVSAPSFVLNDDELALLKTCGLQLYAAADVCHCWLLNG